MLNADFSELLALLNAHNVSYMVIGGYAVAFHGHPRYTKDIDIWIDNSPGNARRMVACLEEFGFGSLKLGEADFTASGNVIQLGYPPRRVDIITGITGLAFDDFYRNRETVVLDNVSVTYIDLEGLIATKQAAGRLQDLADIEKLGSKRG